MPKHLIKYICREGHLKTPNFYTFVVNLLLLQTHKTTTLLTSNTLHHTRHLLHRQVGQRKETHKKRKYKSVKHIISACL